MEPIIAQPLQDFEGGCFGRVHRGICHPSATPDSRLVQNP